MFMLLCIPANSFESIVNLSSFLALMQSFHSNLDQRLIKQARRLDRLTLLLRQHLPPECDGHYHVANIRNRTLVIITDSPVWTTRLRQLSPIILDTLAQSFTGQFQHVQVNSRINYQHPQQPQKPLVKRYLSKQASEQILQSSSTIEDKGLKNALTRLARHGQK